VTRTFPEGFRWGVACSGHQTEGGNRRSDTWFLEHVRPTVFREPSGQACNGYQLWREDVDLVAAAGATVELELVPGASHFWNGASDVAAIVRRSIEFLRAQARPEAAGR